MLFEHITGQIILEDIERKLYFLIPISLISTFDRVLTIMEEENKIMSASCTSKGTRLPYDGLFGDSNLIRVLRQVIADPFTEYRPIDLEKLTNNCAPTVRDSLKTLTSLGLLIKDESDHQHPVYRVNTESKRYLALTFLAYAVLDDKKGTDCMDDVIADYCDSISKGICGSCEFRQPSVGMTNSFSFAVDIGRQMAESLWSTPIHNQQEELCTQILAVTSNHLLGVRQMAESSWSMPIQSQHEELYVPPIGADTSGHALEGHSKQMITTALA